MISEEMFCKSHSVKITDSLESVRPLSCRTPSVIFTDFFYSAEGLPTHLRFVRIGGKPVGGHALKVRNSLISIDTYIMTWIPCECVSRVWLPL